MGDISPNRKFSADGSRPRNVSFDAPLTPEEQLRRNTLEGLKKIFTLDRIFAETTEQQQLFESVGTPIVNHVLQGYNGTLLSYGQTGSGKTHSMFGPDGGKAACYHPSDVDYSRRGLLPRMMESLFESLERLHPVEREWSLRVSVFEIYKEEIFDLIPSKNPTGSSRSSSAAPRPPPSGNRTPRSGDASPRSARQTEKYRIREDTINGKGIYVESLEMVEVRTTQEVMKLVQSAAQKRHTEATDSNDTSSRSHILVCCYLDQIDHTIPDGPAEGVRTTSQLNFVDLAGSEKVSKSKAEGERLKEAQQINLSLTLLGNVIHRLTDGSFGYIPYRDSKLTRILQESLGGNSITTLVCHCAVSMIHREETLSTLRFAQRAKMVRNKPRVNRDLTNVELKEQLAAAHQRIELLEQKVQVCQASAARVKEEEVNPLQALVDSLMKQVEELKEDMINKTVELSKEKRRASFYQKEHDNVKRDLFEREKKSQSAQKALEAALQQAQEESKRQKEEYATLQAELDRLRSTMADKIRTPSCLSSAKKSGTASPLGGFSARRKMDSAFTSPRSYRGGSTDPQCRLFADPNQTGGACLHCGHVVRETKDAECSTVNEKEEPHSVTLNEQSTTSPGVPVDRKHSSTQVFQSNGVVGNEKGDLYSASRLSNDSEEVSTLAQYASPRGVSLDDGGTATEMATRGTRRQEASPSVTKPEEGDENDDSPATQLNPHRRATKEGQELHTREESSGGDGGAPSTVAHLHRKKDADTMTEDDAMVDLVQDWLREGKATLDKELVLRLYQQEFPHSELTGAAEDITSDHCIINGSLNSEAILARYTAKHNEYNERRDREIEEERRKQKQQLREMEVILDHYQQALNESLLLLLTDEEKQQLKLQLMERRRAGSRRSSTNSPLVPTSSRFQVRRSSSTTASSDVIKHQRSSLEPPPPLAARQSVELIDIDASHTGASQVPRKEGKIITTTSDDGGILRHRRSSVETNSEDRENPSGERQSEQPTLLEDQLLKGEEAKESDTPLRSDTTAMGTNDCNSPNPVAVPPPSAAASEKVNDIWDYELLELIKEMNGMDVLDRVINEFMFYKSAEEPALRRALKEKDTQMIQLEQTMQQLQYALSNLYQQIAVAAMERDSTTSPNRCDSLRGSLPSESTIRSAASSLRHSRRSMPDALREQVRMIQKENDPAIQGEPAEVVVKEDTVQIKEDEPTQPFRESSGGGSHSNRLANSQEGSTTHGKDSPEMLSSASDAFNRFETEKYDFMRKPSEPAPPTQLVAHTPLRTEQGERSSGGVRLAAYLSADPTDTTTTVNVATPVTIDPTKYLFELAEQNTQLVAQSSHQLIVLLSQMSKLKHLSEARKRYVEQLESELELAMNRKEDYAQETDALRQMIDTHRRENDDMQRVLKDLNIDLEDYLRKLSEREDTAQRWEKEAKALKIKTSRLLTVAEQQEFCDMGEIELAMKAEDVEVLKDELEKCRTYQEPKLAEKKRKLITRDITLVKRFCSVMLRLLQLRPRFDTANLESRRLNMLESLAELSKQVESVSGSLLRQ